MSETNQRSRSTLHDIARVSGVSVSTVSSVLTGNSEGRRISEETRSRVTSAAKTLAYTPSLLHRSIRRGKTHIISLFNAFRRRDRDDLYLDRLLGAIEEAAGDLGFNVLVHANYKQGLDATYKFINGGFSDGLVLFGSAVDEPLLPLLKASSLPTVLIAPRYASPDFPCVVDDEAMGMRFVADALVEHGHRRIGAVVYEAGNHFDPTGRLARLRAELSKHNLTVDEENVIVFEGDPHETADRILSLNPHPTALFIWHDGNAYRILEALEARHVSIPKDLSIIGYDGIVWPSSSAHVVASVHVPVDDLARAGVLLLEQLISGAPVVSNPVIPVQFSKGTTLMAPSSPP